MNPSTKSLQTQDSSNSHEKSKTEKRFTRLRTCVRASGGNAAVAEKSGLGTTTISIYQNGSEWKLSIIEKIAAACGVSSQWLLFGEENEHSVTHRSTIPTPTTQMIRSYPDIQAIVGLGQHSNAETPPPRTPLPSEILEELKLSPENAILIRVSDDSMTPTLMPSDRVLVDTSTSNYLSGIYVFVSDGVALLKRLSLDPSGYVDITSDNARYPANKIPREDKLGKAARPRHH